MASLRAATAALAVVGGIVATIAVGGFTVVGCGGDTGQPTAEGGDEQQSVEGGSDVGVTSDTGRETSAADAKADAFGGGDAPADRGAVDSTTMVDAPADSARDGDATVTPGDAADATQTSDVIQTMDVVTTSDAADVIAADVADATTVMDAAAEAGVDATAMDAGSVDSGVDAGTAADASDATADVVDANTLDASDAADAPDGKVIPPGLLAYPGQYATAICTGFANCCGAGFDVTACRNTFITQGYDNTLPVNRNAYSAGNLTFSQTQGAACIAALQNWPCATPITSLQNQFILQACHGVFGGTIPIGGTGCLSSFECVTGAYCDPNGLVCRALVGNGGTCISSGESPDHQCNYISNGLATSYCNVYPAGGGTSTGTGTCQPVQPNGGLCSDLGTVYSDYACANQLCDFAGTAACAATTTNPADPTNGFECGIFFDAGGGG